MAGLKKLLLLAAAPLAVSAQDDNTIAPLTTHAPDDCFHFNMGYRDPNVTNVNGGVELKSYHDCQHTCAGMVTCKVFTFYHNSGGCWLQQGDLELVEIPGATSGPRVCPGDSTTPNITMPVLPPVPTVNVTMPPPVVLPPVATIAPVLSDVTTEEPSTSEAETTEEATTTEEPVEDVNSTTVAAVVVAATGEEGSAMPSWAWVIIGLCAAAVITLCAYFMCCTSKEKPVKKAKKTRGVEKKKIDTAPAEPEVEAPLMAAEQPAPMAQPEPLPTVSAPMPTYQPMAGSYQMQAPMMMAAPQPQMAQSMMYQQQQPQVVSYAQPVQYAAYPQVMSAAQPMQQMVAAQPAQMFDVMDRNHDGVITRQEFAQATGGMA